VQVLDVDLERERISLSLKATQQDPWQEFTNHRVGELVYGGSPNSCPSARLCRSATV
jgi:ribosomal protein S1